MPLEESCHVFVACEFPAICLCKSFFNGHTLVVTQPIDLRVLLLDFDDDLRKLGLGLLRPRRHAFQQ